MFTVPQKILGNASVFDCKAEPATAIGKCCVNKNGVPGNRVSVTVQHNPAVTVASGITSYQKLCFGFLPRATEGRQQQEQAD
jgi:hypothetical protein